MGREVSLEKPALVYLGVADLIYSPSAVKKEVQELGAPKRSGVRYVADAGIGHELPRADGFSAMINFINVVDRRNPVDITFLSDGSLVLTPDRYTRTIFFLHGAFQTTEEYANAWRAGRLPLPMDCKVVFPQAPTRAFSLPVGLPGFASERRVPFWFDYPEDVLTAEASVEKICNLIKEEMGTSSSTSVHLAGFSQGACVGWVIYARQLAQIKSFTSFCAGPSLVPSVKPSFPLNSTTPAFVYSGLEDLVFSPNAVKHKVTQLFGPSGMSNMRFVAAEGVRHELPNAEAFANMVSFIDEVDKRV